MFFTGPQRFVMSLKTMIPMGVYDHYLLFTHSFFSPPPILPPAFLTGQRANLTKSCIAFFLVYACNGSLFANILHSECR